MYSQICVEGVKGDIITYVWDDCGIAWKCRQDKCRAPTRPIFRGLFFFCPFSHLFISVHPLITRSATYNQDWTMASQYKRSAPGMAFNPRDHSQSTYLWSANIHSSLAEEDSFDDGFTFKKCKYIFNALLIWLLSHDNSARNSEIFNERQNGGSTYIPSPKTLEEITGVRSDWWCGCSLDWNLIIISHSFWIK